MAHLTKAQSQEHKQAEELPQKDTLALDEKIFVLDHWNEAPTHDNTRLGAFFTPLGLANDFKLDVHGSSILDICAGIGVLAFAAYHFKGYPIDAPPPNVTCIEVNPDYVRVGRKVLSEATWICANIFDVWKELPRFTTAIANPPFGHIRQHSNAPRYTGADFEYKIIDIAAHVAEFGAF